MRNFNNKKNLFSIEFMAKAIIIIVAIIIVLAIVGPFVAAYFR